MASCEITELGQTCTFPESFQKKLGNQWLVAKKLSTPRAYSLFALSELIKEFEGIGMTALACADAYPGLGLAGILWKKHFGDKVIVTVNTHDQNCKEAVEKNANGADVRIVHEDANAFLCSSNKLNFVYLEAYGTSVKYLESACRVVCHRGLMCIVSTDISTLYNKCPERVHRIYHGHTMKNEYVKELSVRLILANVARAASRWDRGISVLLANVDENCITIIVRVLKGASHADKTLNALHKVAHCRVCHYRCIIREKLHYTPNKEITNCLCKDMGLVEGDILPPIVMLGPVYTGAIFHSEYLLKMWKSCVELYPKHFCAITLQNMAQEGFCFNSDNEEIKFLKILESITKMENHSNEPPSKKTKFDADLKPFLENYSSCECPVFFYLAQTFPDRGLNPPKLHAVIEGLRAQGFKASKTTFDPRGAKTSATPAQFRKVVNNMASKTRTAQDR